MKPLFAISLILMTWSLIYLSFLGERELRGEEGRRIIPAQEMIQNDQWVVPTLAGEAYGNKPPLINWVIAGSFLLTGSQSELAARLPSVLSLLALALATFFTLQTHYGVKRAVSVALIILTAGSMIEKCRMAEIESVFIMLFGFACLSWIALWTSGKSPWLIWTVPYLFIGIGSLAKGPVHLIFWILFLIPVLRSARSLRELFHPAHLVGLFIMAAVALPWVFANLAAVEKPDDSVGNWINEITKRADFSPEALKGWMTHPLEILINFFPWTIPLLFSLWCLRKKEKPSLPLPKWDAVARGCFWSGILTALALLSIPGGLPRYLLPLYVPVAIAVVTLYFKVDEKPRAAYERFVYRSLLILTVILFLVMTGGTVVSIQRGLNPMWFPLVLSVVLLAGFMVWIFKEKTKPGVFISTPLAMAIAYFFISSVSLPFEREHYQFRSGAAEIRDLTAEIEGKRVFYADSEYRNSHPKHLRLLYYLGDDFVDQGESKQLPDETRFLIGRKGSAAAMETLAARFGIQRKVELEVDGLTLTALFLGPGES